MLLERSNKRSNLPISKSPFDVTKDEGSGDFSKNDIFYIAKPETLQMFEYGDKIMIQ